MKRKIRTIKVCLASFIASLRASLARFYARLRGYFVGILHATLCLEG